MKHIPILACFLYSLSLSHPVSADQVFEAVEYNCDTKAKRLQILYQEFWNHPAPSGFISGPGSHQNTCDLDKFRIDTEVTLYKQGGGTCGATPGSMIVIKNNNTQIYKEHLHHCSSNTIDRLQITVLDDTIEITICGSAYYKGSKGPQDGCYTERHKREKMPTPLISREYPPPELVVFPSDLCSSHESVIFTCRITEDKFKSKKEKLVSLCASPTITTTSGYLQYRFGRVGDKAELTYPPALENPNNHFQFGALESMGGNRYLRFSNGGYSYYVVFTGDQKGVLVEKSGKRIAQIPCQGGWWHLDSRPIENIGIPKI